MSNYPELADVFIDKVSGDNITSSDPNNCFDAIENIEGLIGALGKPQTWSTTLMTVIRKYRRGMLVQQSGGSVIVTAGEAVLENTSGSKWSWRQNPANVTLAAANLDVGSVAAATYYVYACAPTAGSTSPIKFSTDANAPSGVGTSAYQYLGYFCNISASVAPSGCFDKDTIQKLGNWIDKSASYGSQIALTDGFVQITSLGSGAGGGFIAYSDSALSPTTIRTQSTTVNGYQSGLMPVKKGDSWMVAVTGAGGSITSVYWIPLGV
jgi:hypothetical protein